MHIYVFVSQIVPIYLNLIMFTRTYPQSEDMIGSKYAMLASECRQTLSGLTVTFRTGLVALPDKM